MELSWWDVQVLGVDTTQQFSFDMALKVSNDFDLPSTLAGWRSKHGEDDCWLLVPDTAAAEVVVETFLSPPAREGPFLSLSELFTVPARSITKVSF